MPPAGKGKKKAEAVVAPPQESNEILQAEGGEAVVAPVAPAPPAAPPTKKKAKKPVKVVAVVTPDGIQGSFIAEPRRPLIAHLQIKTNDVMFHDQPLQYDPNPPVQPEPYDPSADNMFMTSHEQVDTPQTEEKDAEEKAVVDATLYTATATAAVVAAPAAADEIRPLQCLVKADLMVEFRESNKQKRLPDSTDIACFWCCSSFTWMPCIIPEREVNGVYNVYGNFCCPECAVAHLLSENLDPHVRWERMALLHRIYDTQAKGRIFPAPSRECLKLFGGPLSADSFRATVREGRVRVDVHLPPMVSILGSIDTKPIDFFDSSLKNTIAGNAFQAEKVQKAEEGLRLKRTKPLKDKESTLDSVMNIQVKGTGGRARQN
jgi:hypothetical protein